MKRRMPWWGLGLIVIGTCLAVWLVVFTGMLPRSTIVTMDLYSGRVCYEEQVCGLTTHLYIREDGMAGSILEFRGSYPPNDEWELIYRIDRTYRNSVRRSTPLDHAHFELLNCHDNLFDGGLSRNNDDYERAFSPEVKAIIAERTLEVLRTTLDYDGARQYQNYITYACKGIDYINDTNLVPTVEEFLRADFQEEYPCFE